MVLKLSINAYFNVFVLVVISLTLLLSLPVGINSTYTGPADLAVYTSIVEKFSLPYILNNESGPQADIVKYRLNITQAFSDILSHKYPENTNAGAFTLTVEYSLNFDIFHQNNSVLLVSSHINFPGSWIYWTPAGFVYTYHDFLDTYDENETQFNSQLQTQLAMLIESYSPSNDSLLYFKQHWIARYGYSSLRSSYLLDRLFITTLEGQILAVIVDSYYASHYDRLSGPIFIFP